MSIKLIRMMCPSNKYSIKCPYEMEADGICVHNTANKASAKAEISYMIGNNNQVSYHYAVDNNMVVQGIEESRNTWHAGDGNGKGNRKKLSIEICYSTNPDVSVFLDAEKLAAKFIAYKLKEKGWGIDRVSKHQDYSKKYCPHKTLDLGWQRFLNLIKEELGENNAHEKEKDERNTYTVKVVCDVLNVRNGAGTNNKINTQIKKNEVYTIVEEKNGWGKLKSGAGWICLSYTERTGTKTTKTTTVSYFKRYTGNSGSIAEALKSIGADSSYSYRCKIASKNGISNYKGTASQNTQMLSLLKKGTLLKP